MHTEKQRIFNDYAKSLNDFDRKLFENFLTSVSIGNKTIREHMYVACDLVQQEQQKRIAENVETLYPYEDKKHWINKDTILNPENIIK